MIELPGLARPVPEDVFEEVACGLCGSAERDLRFTDGPFSVVACRACGLTYVTPRLRDAALLQQVYDEGYWSSSAAKDRGYTDYRSDAPLYLRTYKKRLAVVRRHFARPGRVLDVGCAAGYFLEVMRDEGWEVTGLEPSDAIRPHAVARLGADRVRGDLLEDAPFAPGSFDLVTFWDVIEHVPDVVGTLRRARALLAPGGRLLLETQNVESLAARCLGRAWQHYKHAEHLYHFSPSTLRRLLDAAGYELLESSPRLGGKYVSLGFVAERSGRLHPALAWLMSPLRLVARRAVYVNLRDELIVVARPRG
ncbi:MAG TPA: class I SAM-dependent methyltransferase [Planctomycetota bacterium]|nr:class I SAM-dependent methyltransferase [Planctomycetota bacterium]